MNKVPIRIVCELLRKQILEALAEFPKMTAMWEAVVHNLYELHGAALDHLIEHILRVEDARCVPLVRVEAANVVNLAALQSCQEEIQVLQVGLAD